MDHAPDGCLRERTVVRHSFHDMGRVQSHRDRSDQPCTGLGPPRKDGLHHRRHRLCRRPYVCSYPILCPVSTIQIHRGEGNAYQLDKEQLRLYESHVAQLCCHTLVWPPIRLSRIAASKWPTLCHLQTIARLRGEYMPTTICLKKGQDIPHNMVLKRSHSECCEHVILPTASRHCVTWERLNSETGNDEFWMAQEYVQSLDKIGEWRVFIIGGNVISVMHTYKSSNDRWHGEVAGSFLTLDEIRCACGFHSSHFNI